MKVAIPVAALLLLAGCAHGPTVASREARAAAESAAAPAEAAPAPAPVAAPERSSDRGRRTLLPTPIGQLTPEDVPTSPAGGR